jgi:hypothetical protein
VTFCLYVYARNTALFRTPVQSHGLKAYLLTCHVSTPDDTTGVQKSLALGVYAHKRKYYGDRSTKRKFSHRPYFLEWRSIHRHNICVTSTVAVTETVGVLDVFCSLFIVLKTHLCSG